MERATGPWRAERERERLVDRFRTRVQPEDGLEFGPEPRVPKEHVRQLLCCLASGEREPHGRACGQARVQRTDGVRRRVAKDGAPGILVEVEDCSLTAAPGRREPEIGTLSAVEDGKAASDG